MSLVYARYGIANEVDRRVRLAANCCQRAGVREVSHFSRKLALSPHGDENKSLV